MGCCDDLVDSRAEMGYDRKGYRKTLMLFRSKAQARWAHSVGEKALGGAAKVHEWDQSTDFSGLPDRVAGKGDGPMRSPEAATRKKGALAMRRDRG
jgi:hypothetical protein